MRIFIALILSIFSIGAYAQTSDLIIRGNDSSDFTFLIEGKEYKLDDASVLKITDIPSSALVNITIMLKSTTPMAFFDRMAFVGSFEHDYSLKIPEKGNKLELELNEKTEKIDGYKPSSLGSNFITYRFNKYAAPTERIKETYDAASSLKMKREREKSDTTRMEDGKKIEEKSERKRTVKEEGSSTVIHTERKTTGDGDNRETTILKPRKEDCNGDWDKKTKENELANLALERSEPGKLYVSKTIAINNCFTAEDAKQIMNVFDSEATRIEMAKFMYPSLTDPENFEVLEEYFESPSSWEAVLLYIDIKYK